MTRRSVLIISLLAILAAAIAWGLRFTASDAALVVRRGEALTVVNGAGWYPRWIGQECSVALQQDRLFFSENVPFEDENGEQLVADVRFLYETPSMPVDAARGVDWCTLLRVQVERYVAEWGRTRTAEAIGRAPREEADALIQSLTASLGPTGLRASSIAARPIVSPRLAAVQSRPAVVSASRKAPPVFFVGLDGADWQLLRTYMDAGLMPNLQQLVREGTSGPLETMHPALSPILWTTMMTGRTPVNHGILDFTRFNPVSGSKEPITSDERQVPAVWNMMTLADKSVASFGMWATYPAEPVRGVLVSDRFFTFLFKEAVRPPAVVFPPSREQWAFDELQKVEAAIGYEQVRAYMPWLQPDQYERALQAESAYADPVGALRRILVETEIYHRLATQWAREHESDLTILYLQGTDSIGHTFAAYAPPQQPSVSAEEFQKFSRVPELYFRHVDELLGQYRDLVASQNGILMLASDHGFLWSEGRPEKLSSFEMATAAKWHRREGIILFWKPDGSARGTTPGGTILDVTPTLLALTGAAADPALEGRVIPGAPVVSGRGEVAYAEHHEPFRITEVPAESAAVDDELAKLRALGYLGGGESDRAAPGSTEEGSTRTAGWYNNLALIRQGDGDEAGAVEAWEQALRIDPALASAAWNLSDVMFDRADYDRADELLIQASRHGLPERRRYIIGRAIGYQRDGQAERSLRLISRAVEIMPDEPEIRMFRGRYRVELDDCRGALQDFHAVQRMTPTSPAPYSSAGLAAMCLGDTNEARRQFSRSLQLNPQQPQLQAYLQQLAR